MRTAILPMLLFCIAPCAVRADVPEELKETAAFVLGLQTKSGGFQNAPAKEGEKAKPTLRATSAAVRALHYMGGKPKDKEACSKYVASCFDKASGGFANTPSGEPDLFSTAVGVMAVTALGMDETPYRDGAVMYLSENAKSFEDIRIAVAGLERFKMPAPKAAAWLEAVLKLRNADGTYGKDTGVGRATGSAVVAALRLGGKVEDRAKVLQTLNAAQRMDGGFGKEDSPKSDLETCYRVMRCYHMLKAKPQDEEGLRSYVAKCRNEECGYSLQPGEPSTVSATYFAVIVLHWLNEK